MSVSSAMEFPIRLGSQAAQVSGIYAFVDGYTYDAGLSTGKERRR